jgi:hypothetical protein
MLHASDPKVCVVCFRRHPVYIYTHTRTHARTHERTHERTPPPQTCQVMASAPSCVLACLPDSCWGCSSTLAARVDVHAFCGLVVSRVVSRASTCSPWRISHLSPLSISHQLDGIQHQSLHVLFQRMLPWPQVFTFDDIYMHTHTHIHTHTFTHIHIFHVFSTPWALGVRLGHEDMTNQVCLTWARGGVGALVADVASSGATASTGSTSAGAA